MISGVVGGQDKKDKRKPRKWHLSEFRSIVDFLSFPHRFAFTVSILLRARQKQIFTAHDRSVSSSRLVWVGLISYCTCHPRRASTKRAGMLR